MYTTHVSVPSAAPSAAVPTAAAGAPSATASAVDPFEAAHTLDVYGHYVEARSMYLQAVAQAPADPRARFAQLRAEYLRTTTARDTGTLAAIEALRAAPSSLREGALVKLEQRIKVEPEPSLRAEAQLLAATVHSAPNLDATARQLLVAVLQDPEAPPALQSAAALHWLDCATRARSLGDASALKAALPTSSPFRALATRLQLRLRAAALAWTSIALFALLTSVYYTRETRKNKLEAAVAQPRRGSPVRSIVAYVLLVAAAFPIALVATSAVATVAPFFALAAAVAAIAGAAALRGRNDASRRRPATYALSAAVACIAAAFLVVHYLAPAYLAAAGM
jgi:hypothetical protein